jgi:hypothetical protein
MLPGSREEDGHATPITPLGENGEAPLLLENASAWICLPRVPCSRTGICDGRHHG